jgi:hypothetical protein
MVAFDPDPSIRWLFCMTHPDDEISICAWIKRLTDAGAEVWISWTHASPVRQAEAGYAAEELGVPLTRLFFHGAEDGRVVHQMADLLPSFSAMIQKVQPARIACGAFEQGHLDHDATNCLVHQVFDGPVFEIPFYYSYLTRMPRVNRFEDPTREEVIELSPAAAAAKRYYAKLFPSQRIWRNMVWANMRSKLNGDGSLSKTERMRLQLPTDFTRVQHSGALGKRIEESDRWQEWLKAYQSFRVSQL